LRARTCQPQLVFPSQGPPPGIAKGGRNDYRRNPRRYVSTHNVSPTKLSRALPKTGVSVSNSTINIINKRGSPQNMKLQLTHSVGRRQAHVLSRTAIPVSDAFFFVVNHQVCTFTSCCHHNTFTTLLDRHCARGAPLVVMLPHFWIKAVQSGPTCQIIIVLGVIARITRGFMPAF